MGDNQAITLFSIDGSLEAALSDESFQIPPEMMPTFDQFMSCCHSATDIQYADPRDDDAIASESSEVKPVGKDPNGFMETRLREEWEKADKLRQQVDLNHGDKQLMEDWQKACLVWSERNRDIGPVPQVKSKSTGGKVGENVKAPMPKTLKCPFCETWTQTFTTLKRHLNLELKDYKPFECEVCQADFCRSDALKQHAKVHQR